MERIGTIAKATELMRQPNVSEPLLTLLRPPSSDELAAELGDLMIQAKLFKPNQALPSGTPDLYLQAWEELAQEWGMERFQAGLWRALRKSAFFPQPNEIEAACVAIRDEDREAKRIARETNERQTRERELLEGLQRHKADHPEMYDAEGNRLPGESVWKAKEPAARKPTEPKPEIVHAVTAADFGTTLGWFTQTCSCGKTWTTFGQVEVCPDDNWGEYARLVEAGLAQAKPRK